MKGRHDVKIKDFLVLVEAIFDDKSTVPLPTFPYELLHSKTDYDEKYYQVQQAPLQVF